MGNKIAILGLGAMGSRMAKRLLDAQHNVVVYNRTAERAQPLMAAKKFAPMFPIDLVEKDFGCVVDTAAMLESQTPIAAAVRTVYAEAKAKGLGNANIVGIAKLFE